MFRIPLGSAARDQYRRRAPLARGALEVDTPYGVRLRETAAFPDRRVESHGVRNRCSVRNGLDGPHHVLDVRGDGARLWLGEAGVEHGTLHRFAELGEELLQRIQRDGVRTPAFVLQEDFARAAP